MFKKAVWALGLLVMAGLACTSTDSLFSKSSSETESQVEQYSEEQTPGIPFETNIPSYPNLTLRAVVEHGLTLDLGNGMKRITVILSPKNASSSWWSYAVEGAGFTVPTECFWVIGADPWSGYRGNPPVLLTKEGYTYEAVRKNSYCGPRYTWDIPPGMTVVLMGPNLEELSYWGFIMFDIPSSATPDSITVPYSNTGNLFTISESYEILTVTAEVTDTWPSAEFPFDPAFSDYIDVYRVGEKIRVGDLVEVEIRAERPQTTGSLEVQFYVQSLDKGYPIELGWESGASLYVASAGGTLCCYSTPGDWGFDYSSPIGPEQSATLDVALPNPGGEKAWLLVGLVFKETAGPEIEASAQFVVELP